jgi:hypothetical protein
LNVFAAFRCRPKQGSLSMTPSSFGPAQPRQEVNSSDETTVRSTQRRVNSQPAGVGQKYADLDTVGYDQDGYAMRYRFKRPRLYATKD